jgi:two-component system cell cycle response regulator
MASENKPLLLVIDDDDEVRSLVEQLLLKENYRVVLATNGASGLATARELKPDLIILDVVMPEMNGLSLCRVLKSDQGNAFLPIILMTAKNDPDSRVQGLKTGADDYMGKPVDTRELLARIEALLQIKRLYDRLASSNKIADDVTFFDQATGLFNERHLHERLAEEFERAERYSEPLSCIAISLDKFAELSHQSAHETIDILLREIADIIRAGVREFDVIARSAQDCFTVLLPRTHFTGSLAVAGRICRQVQTMHIIGPDGKVLHVSVGVSFYPSRDVSSAQGLIEQAQKALELAREAGSDQICLLQQSAYFYQPDSTL